MKPSRSHRHLHLLTDFTLPTELNRNSSCSKARLPNTCKNNGKNNYDGQDKIPQTCKNKFKQLMSPQANSSNHSKFKKSRSNSNVSREAIGPGEVIANQSRRQQIDMLCFQKLMNQIRRLLIEEKCKWNIDVLNYQQLIRILYRLKYVQHGNENQYISEGDQEELKKIYCLWISISSKRVFKLKDLIEIIHIIEKINIEVEKISEIIAELKIEINNLEGEFDTLKIDPTYVFFMKKIDLKREVDSFSFSLADKTLIAQKFDSFKLNRLKNSSPAECPCISELQNEDQPLVSKKSVELATSKREKMSKKIKNHRPHVENIDLFDLLNYRERDYCGRTPKSSNESDNISKFSKKKKSIRELKKDIDDLSKPKLIQNLGEDELKFQRNKEDYTFTPKINPYQGTSQEKSKNIKNLEKTVLRMKEGREIKEQKENIINKGWTISEPKKMRKSKEIKALEEVRVCEKINDPQQEKTVKYEVSKDYLKIPILYIDVNIEEGKKERIIIYDNDTAKGLATEFGNKHGLNEETVSRLEGLLQQQMDTVLARIDQQTEDECSIIF